MAALGLAACEGRTDPATNVHAGGATLRFTGTADNGPAFSYFEYWKTAEGQQASRRTPTRTWPAGASGTATEVVNGLSRDTDNTFRACGGDSGGPAACAATRSFRTLNSDALVLKNGSALEFVGASGFGQDVIVSRTVSDGVARFTFFEGNNNGIVPAAGSGCTTDPGSPLDNVVRCSTSGITRIRLRLGDVSDGGFADTGAVRFTIDGGPGGDGLGGAGNRDFIVGGPGVDSFFGGEGDDTINARDGEVDNFQSSVIDCGENRDGSADADVAYIDDNGELHQNCEDVRTTTPPPAP